MTDQASVRLTSIPGEPGLVPPFNEPLAGAGDTGEEPTSDPLDEYADEPEWYPPFDQPCA